MSPYVLVLVLFPSTALNPNMVVLDMPSAAECLSSLDNWRKIWTQGKGGMIANWPLSGGINGFCASRDGKELVE